MEKKDIQSLGELARIKLSEEEVKTYTGDFDSILTYVDELKKNVIKEKEEGNIGMRDSKNTGLREDIVIPSIHRDAIISQFPERDGDRVKVPEVLSYED